MMYKACSIMFGVVKLSGEPVRCGRAAGPRPGRKIRRYNICCVPYLPF